MIANSMTTRRLGAGSGFAFGRLDLESSYLRSWVAGYLIDQHEPNMNACPHRRPPFSPRARIVVDFALKQSQGHWHVIVGSWEIQG